MRTLAPILLSALLASGCTQLGLMGSSEQTRSLAEQARQGDAGAQYALGLRFTNGADAQQNYGLGLKYFEQAARQGHVDAQYMLGMGYYTGRGVGRDYTEALAWLEKAAMHTHREAMHYTGESYLNGYGSRAEPAWGVHWIAQAAEAGYPRAQYLLGVSLVSGIGNERNRSAGVHWLQLAQSNGNGAAQELLQLLGERPRTLSHSTQLNAKQLAQRYETRYVQLRLTQLGYSTAGVDGSWGPRSQAAAVRFWRAEGMSGTPSLQQLITRLRARPES